MINDCDCGSTTCQNCGPAQGYTVKRVWDPEFRRYVWINPEDDGGDPGQEPIVYTPDGNIV